MKYRLLRDNETIMAGDEYCCSKRGNEDWEDVYGSIGLTPNQANEISLRVGVRKIFRRKVK